jgi:hypothetical protein
MFGAPHFAPNVNLTSLPCKRRRQRLAGSGSIVLYCFVLFCIASGLFSRAKPWGELYRARLRRQQVKSRWPVPWEKISEGPPHVWNGLWPSKPDKFLQAR